MAAKALLLFWWAAPQQLLSTEPLQIEIDANGSCACEITSFESYDAEMLWSNGADCEISSYSIFNLPTDKSILWKYKVNCDSDCPALYLKMHGESWDTTNLTVYDRDNTSYSYQFVSDQSDSDNEFVIPVPPSFSGTDFYIKEQLVDAADVSDVGLSFLRGCFDIQSYPNLSARESVDDKCGCSVSWNSPANVYDPHESGVKALSVWQGVPVIFTPNGSELCGYDIECNAICEITHIDLIGPEISSTNTLQIVSQESNSQSTFQINETVSFDHDAGILFVRQWEPKLRPSTQFHISQTLDQAHDEVRPARAQSLRIRTKVNSTTSPTSTSRTSTMIPLFENTSFPTRLPTGRPNGSLTTSEKGSNSLASAETETSVFSSSSSVAEGNSESNQDVLIALSVDEVIIISVVCVVCFLALIVCALIYYRRKQDTKVTTNESNMTSQEVDPPAETVSLANVKKGGSLKNLVAVGDMMMDDVVDEMATNGMNGVTGEDNDEDEAVMEGEPHMDHVPRAKSRYADADMDGERRGTRKDTSGAPGDVENPNIGPDEFVVGADEDDEVAHGDDGGTQRDTLGHVDGDGYPHNPNLQNDEFIVEDEEDAGTTKE